jgi:hypothetical protein
MIDPSKGKKAVAGAATEAHLHGPVFKANLGEGDLTAGWLQLQMCSTQLQHPKRTLFLNDHAGTPLAAHEIERIGKRPLQPPGQTESTLNAALTIRMEDALPAAVRLPETQVTM